MTRSSLPAPRRPELKHSDLITARLRLIGQSEVVSVWTTFTSTYEEFSFMLSEDYPGLGADPTEFVPDDDPKYVALVRAIDDLRQALKRAFG